MIFVIVRFNVNDRIIGKHVFREDDRGASEQLHSARRDSFAQKLPKDKDGLYL